MAATKVVTTTAAKPAPAKAPPTPALTAADFGYTTAFLNAHPDVKAKVAAAVTGKWTPARFEAEVKTTGWWRTRTDAQRKSDLLQTDNPTEYHRQVELKQQDLLRASTAMGVSLDPAMAWQLAKKFFGAGSSDAEVQWGLASRFNLSEDLSGQAAADVDSLRQQAGDFGITLDDKALEGYVQNMLGGKMDAQGYTDAMREQAKILYAPIAGALDRGQTVRQYLNPYLSMAAKEGLITDPASVDLSDAKWTAAVSSMQQPGQPMSADEWTRTMRSDSRYGWDQTQGAKDTAAQFVAGMSRLFGGFQ